MLQLRRLNKEVVETLRTSEPLPPRPWSLETLERVTNTRIDTLRRLREVAARTEGPVTRAREAFDRHLRTTTLERLDRPEVSPERKHRIVRDLHDLNETVFSYRRFTAAMAPFIARVNERTGRPARVLELACGAGELALQLPKLAAARGLQVEVTASDVVPAYLEAGQAEAARRGVPVRFLDVNAFDLGAAVERGAYDVVFIGQSLHHFTAGQLALMMAGTRDIQASAFVAVDGRRSLLLLSLIPGYGLCFKSLDFAHDALLSTRKFYSEPELALIAELAVPEAPARVRSSHPGYTIVTLDLDGASP